MDKNEIVIVLLISLSVGLLWGGYIFYLFPQSGISATYRGGESLITMSIDEFYTPTRCVILSGVGEVCYLDGTFYVDGTPVFYEYVKNVKLHAFDGQQVIFMVGHGFLPAQSTLGVGEPSSPEQSWYPSGPITPISFELAEAPTSLAFTKWGTSTNSIDLGYAAKACVPKLTQTLISPSGKVVHQVETPYSSVSLLNGKLYNLPPTIEQEYKFISAGKYTLSGTKTWRCDSTLGVVYAWTDNSVNAYMYINPLPTPVTSPQAPIISLTPLSSNVVSCDGSKQVQVLAQYTHDVSFVLNSKVINGIWNGDKITATIFHSQMLDGTNKLVIAAFNPYGIAKVEQSLIRGECVTPITTTLPPTTSPPPTSEPTIGLSPSPRRNESSPVDCSTQTICVFPFVENGEFTAMRDASTQKCVPNFTAPTGKICVVEGDTIHRTNSNRFWIGFIGAFISGLGALKAYNKWR